MPLPLVHYLYPSGLSKFLRQNENGESSWALITGASDGIGLALAKQLAARGSNIVLHGRNESKLQRCREELEADYPKQHFRVVTADASSFTSEDIDRIVSMVSDIPLTILVNNVGGTAPLSSNFKHFEDTTQKEMDAVFSLNVLFPMKLTCALLPAMQRQQKPTLVLTCGSQSWVGMAYASSYSATKGALHAWNRGLAAEQYEAKSQVEILEVVVGATYTQQLVQDPNMSEGLFMPSAQVMASSILQRVGHGHRSVTAYFWHAAQMSALYMLPVWMADSALANILKPSVEPKKAR